MAMRTARSGGSSSRGGEGRGEEEGVSEPARDALVTAGRSRVKDFDWDHVVDDVLAVYDSVTVNGEHVTEDLRGQLVGRLMGRG
jgi:hypothetical protein